LLGDVAMKLFCGCCSILVSLVLLTGCTPQAKCLQSISLGMQKKEIVKKIGNPRVTRGSIRNQYDQVIDVWEYRLALPSDDSAGEVIGKTATTIMTLGAGAILFDEPQKDYWLYFLDDELVQWGEAGDWQVERQNIYNIRFGPSKQLAAP